MKCGEMDREKFKPVEKRGWIWRRRSLVDKSPIFFEIEEQIWWSAIPNFIALVMRTKFLLSPLRISHEVSRVIYRKEATDRCRFRGGEAYFFAIGNLVDNYMKLFILHTFVRRTGA